MNLTFVYKIRRLETNVQAKNQLASALDTGIGLGLGRYKKERGRVYAVA